MGDLQGAMPVSKDRNSNALANPFFVQLADGATSVSVDAATHALLVKHVAASGTVIGDVRITDGADVVEVVKTGDALAAGNGGLLVAGSDGANARFLATTAAGHVVIDDGGSPVHVANQPATTLAVSGTVTGNQGAPAAALASAWPVKLTDGATSVSVTNTGHLAVDLASQGLGSLAVSRDNNPNGAGNPLYVEVVTAAAGGEVHDYNTAANVASAGVSNHDYAVTAGKTLNLAALRVAASGALRVELLVGPVATLASKFVGFTSVAEPTLQVEFEPPLAVPSTSTGTVRVARTNREPLAMDVYSTISGREV